MSGAQITTTANSTLVTAIIRRGVTVAVVPVDAVPEGTWDRPIALTLKEAIGKSEARGTRCQLRLVGKLSLTKNAPIELSGDAK